MFSTWIHCFVILPRTANWPIFIIYISVALYLIHIYFMIVTLLSRISSSSPCPLLCTLYQRLSRVSLTYILTSVSLFSQLSSLISPFLPSLCSLLFYSPFPCLVGGHFSLLDRNSATLYIRYTLAHIKSIRKHRCTCIYLGFVYN